MEQIIQKNNLLVEYCLLTFVILWSGGYFTYGLFPNWQYPLLLISLYILLKRGIRVERKNLLVVFAFALIAIAHTIVFDGPITSIAQPTVRLLSIAMVAVIVRPNLNHVFIYITSFIAFFSLIFWFIDLTTEGHYFLLDVGKGLPQLGASTLTESNIDRYGYVNYTLYFYTVSDLPTDLPTDLVDSTHRNCGPFFEPGRFTIPLSISMSMILFTENFKKYRIPFFIIFIANLSTLSTTAYLIMITLFVGYFGARSNSENMRTVTMFLLALMASYYLMGLGFMGEKISLALNDTDIANSRFGAMFYHWPQILQSPWIGYGAFLNKIFPSTEMSPCGITDMMRFWGIPMFIVCVTILYQGTRTYLLDKRQYRIVFVTILLLITYTQTIMNEPLLYLLYFIGSNEVAFDNGEFTDEDIFDEETSDDEDIINTYAEEVYAEEI